VTLGERIRKERKAAGLSQRDLAQRVGVSFPHISKVEADKEPASPELLTRIAQEVGIEPDELLLLAGRVPSELSEVVVNKHTLAPRFLRSWKAGTITDEDVEAFLNQREGR
jgi:transcriptional regulator with XRE-family HTH domain